MNVLLRTGLWLGGIAAAAGAAGAIFAWSGLYDVGADAPHARPVYAALEYARQRSVAVRARELSVPADLDDAERVRRGAGNYAAMCAGCHLSPGAEPGELARGLYPAPPNLAQRDVDAASAFWTIKHGIKASGMPGWGGSMDDAHVWDLVAFLGRMPSLDAQGYRELVARSDVHSHGGGEDPSGHGDAGAHAHGNAGDGADATSDADGAHAHRDAPDAAQAEAGAGGGHAHGHGHDDAPAPAPGNAQADGEAKAEADAGPPAGRTHQHADGRSHRH